MKNEHLNRLLRLNNYAFPFLVFLSYFFLSIESITYTGFLLKHIFIDAKIFAIITLISMALVCFCGNVWRNKNNKFAISFVFITNLLLSPILIILYYILTIIEKNHYSNYVYSTFHLQPNNFTYLVLFNLVTAFLFFAGYVFQETKNIDIEKDGLKVMFKDTIFPIKVADLSKISNYIFQILVLLTYLFLFIETYTYSEFLWKHLLLNSKLFAAITILFGVAVHLNKKEKSLKYLRRAFFLFNIILSPLLIVSYVAMLFLENIHYSNYVYSTFHLQLESFVYLVIFNAVIISLLSFNNKNVFGSVFGIKGNIINSKPSDRLNFIVPLKLLIIITLCAYLFGNMGETLNKAMNSDVYILTHLNSTYNEKMADKWGRGFYDYVMFVRDNTPEDANIIAPPQIRPWLTIGNVALVRYFLYPRNVIHLGKGVINPRGGVYIIVYKGRWCADDNCKIWPQQIIRSQQLIVRDPNSSGVKEIRQDFIYDPSDASIPYGLLKL